MGSGLLSRTVAPRTLALTALALSGLCCLVSPLVLGGASAELLLGFLLFWGVVVVADSPMFSSLGAQNAPAEARGTALTIVNCLGFAITVVSLQLMSWLTARLQVPYLFLVLALGPALGLLAQLGSRPATTDAP